MNKLFFFLLCFSPLWAVASESLSLDSAPVDVYDQPSLQRARASMRNIAKAAIR